jgi:hypothetical protein
MAVAIGIIVVVGLAVFTAWKIRTSAPLFFLPLN